MTRDRDFKRLVRTRMRKTGESYAAARARLVPTAQPSPPSSGGQGMYPFERFTERAKKVLTLAQEEAEKKHHHYIGTEHLLLGLLREQDGLAAVALSNLGVDLATVRKTIDSVLGREERLIVRQIIPTSRVKKVIEISFEEALRMGQSYVGTEHLLLGLLIEGEGIAAHVLEDLGATLDKVRAEIGRLLAQGVGAERGPTTRQQPTAQPPLGADAVLAVRLAGHLAEADGSTEVTVRHVQQAITHPAAKPLFELNARLAAADAARRKALDASDYDEAAANQDLLRKLREDFVKAEAVWVKSLGRRRRKPG